MKQKQKSRCGIEDRPRRRRSEEETREETKKRRGEKKKKEPADSLFGVWQTARRRTSWRKTGRRRTSAASLLADFWYL